MGPLDDGRRGTRVAPSSAEESILLPGGPAAKISRDPEDAKFVAAAVEAGAEYVVTGDRDLLDIETYRGVRLIPPATFLGMLRATELG